jgi:hypothetical protein
MVEFILTGIGNELDSTAAQLVTEILNKKVTLDDAWRSATP